MEKFFHLKENGTTVSTEIMAGLTTFFAMSYIIIVNPQILSSTGMPWGGVFLATIIAAIIGTLVMGLFANVPYAQAAGMGLNAFFTYTVCFGLGFKWQETLCMVFLCGLINIIITVTKIRKMIIQAIPEVLQNAIGGGIGLFVAYVGFLNVGFFTFTTKSAAKSGDTVQATPGLAVMNNPTIWLFIIGLVLAIVLTVLKVRGGMLIAIAVTAVVGIPMGQTTMANSVSIADTFAQLPQTFGVIFTKDGFPALFSDVSKLPIILLTIFAFSMSDTFDTIGTFIGTGRRTGIFSAEDEKALENGGIEAAKKVCRETRGPVASIFYQGLLRYEQGIDVVEKTVVSYGSVQMSEMENGLSWIALFIAIAPSLGFLGTVIGMIQAFDAIQAAGDISPNVVAGGMKVALITTVAGLIVAMILQIFYNYILAKIDSITIDMEDSSISLIDVLTKYSEKK